MNAPLIRAGSDLILIDNGSGEPNVVQQTSAGYDLLKKQIQTAIDTAQSPLHTG